MIIFLYRNLSVGGAETLIMRIAKKFKLNGFDTAVVCEAISEVMQKSLEENDIKIEKISGWDFKNILFAMKEEDMVFTFNLKDFCFCENFLKKGKRYCQVILYCVHSEVLKLRRFSIGKNLVKKFMKPILYKYIENGNIIFMNESVITETEQFYGKEINIKENLYRLSIEDIDWNEEYIQKRSCEKTFQILTIARADFPFKGYIKGLIDSFVKLCEKYSNIRLTIISYGSDIQKLQSWLEQVGEKNRKRIVLIGETPYEMLERYYENCDLYVGMGTTILDAAKRGIISINALPYTYDLKTTGFFYDDPYSLGAGIEIPYDAAKLIEKTILFSEDEYNNYRRKTRKVFEKIYLDESFTTRIQERDIKEKKCFIPWSLRVILKLYNRIKST